MVAKKDTLVAVEVKAESMRRPRLPRSCRSFIQAYHPAKLLLVNQSLEHAERLGKTEVIWTVPWKMTALVEEALG